MGILEIVLLLAGIGLAVASFVLPATKEEVPAETKKLAKDEIKTLVSQEMDSIRQHVDDVVDEAVEYAMEKTERSLERLTNEKIMAVNEYSDTVLQEINKSHEEVMFLYDMLNSKHANLKDTVTEATRAAQEVTETTKEAEAVVSTFQQLKPETVEVKEEAKESKATKAEPQVWDFFSGKKADVVNKDAEEVQSENSQVGSDAQVSFAPTVMDFTSDTQTVGMNNNEKILELYRQGKSNVAIAKELGLGVGEVKLVIQLFQNT